MPRAYNTPTVAESKYNDDDTTYLVRKMRARLKAEAKADSVRDIFDKLDRNGDRRITAIEFRAGMKRLGMRLDDWEIRELIKHCDLDGDGEVSFDEFTSFVNSSEMKDSGVQDVLERLREIVEREKARYSYTGLQDVFEEFDSDYSGTVETAELHRGLRKFGITLSVAEAEHVAQRFAGRVGGKIRYRDFVAGIRGVAPASHGMKDAEGDRTVSFAVRRLQQEIERCAKTRSGFDLRSVFREMDLDRSGTLDRGELRAVFEKLGLKLTRSEIIDVMDFFQSGTDDEIPYEVFCKFALKQDASTLRIAQRVKDEIDRLAERRGAAPDYRLAFEEVDRDGSGQMDQTEFVRAMRNLGLRLSSAESRQLMNMFDQDGDGQVSYREFVEFIKSR